MERKEIQDEVMRLVSESQRIPIEKILPTSSLLYDLGIAGDDGYELIEEIRERFNVDFSHLDINKYFGYEGCVPWMLPYDLVMAIVRLFAPPKYHTPITIQDLVEAVIAGSWHDRKQSQTEDSSAQ